MDNSHSEIEQKVTLWAQKGMNLGWVSQKQVQAFNLPNRYNPAPLFSQNDHRPLVMAFFGGTGVGKSTLLNRLANHDIVQVGIERPTSRQATVYHHHTVQLDLFSKEMPLNKVKFISHSDNHYKGIIFIDMPDICSVEQENSQQVINWIPYIDVLIYVVSPDRYQDNNAWKILRDEGKFHTWIFVMNQSDRGVEEQLNDFKNLLKNKSGFHIPLVFRTDCRTYKTTVSIDEFNQLRETILSLEHQYITEQLERRNMKFRMDSMVENIQTTLDTLGDKSTLEILMSKWEVIWNKCYLSLLTDMEQPILEIAQRFAQLESDKKSHGDIDAESSKLDQELKLHENNLHIWNQQAQTQLSGIFKQFIIEIDLTHIPSRPFKMTLENRLNLASGLINSQAEESLLSSLVTISSLAKRTLFKLAGVSELLLPLATLNAEKEALKGLYIGVEKGLNSLKNEIDKSIEETVISKADYFSEGAILLFLCKENTPTERCLVMNCLHSH